MEEWDVFKIDDDYDDDNDDDNDHACMVKWMS